MKLYVSKKPGKLGGGSNTFAWNFVSWASKNGHKIVSKIHKADRAIVIAHFAEIKDLKKAQEKGCYIIHRIDEYFEKDETPYRREKHNKIIALNQYVDITVFQSDFVRDNAYPFIRPKRYTVIHNGGNPREFRPRSQIGDYIGHVTWSVDERKGLHLVRQKNLENPQERFLLVGRHLLSKIDFNFPNVVVRGPVERDEIADEYRKMKMLYFPSKNEPCPNIPIEAILSGVPVCYHNSGGTPEVVQNCGESLERFDHLLSHLEKYRRHCIERIDLHFDRVFKEYMQI